ncbi:hypothetical protein Tco_1491276 [Tanacetum coccineum]
MRELREGTFYGNKDENAHDHIDRPQKGGWTDSPQELLIVGISSKRPLSKGPHLDKDCPLHEEVKQVEKVRYREFGRTTPFNGNNKGKFGVGPSGYYTKTDNRPPYGEKRQSLEELLAKHQEESARRSTEMEVWIKKL